MQRGVRNSFVNPPRGSISNELERDGGADQGVRPTNKRDLYAEGTAATASRLHIRVVELEARAFHGFDIVDFHSVEIQKAGLVDEHIQTVVLVSLVEHILPV